MEEYFKFETLEGPLVEKFKNLNQKHYNTEESIKIHPSSCVLFGLYRDSYAERIRRFTVRPDDVWIITFPKCGTTWTQEMAWLLVNNLDYETARSVEQPKRSLFLEIGSFVLPGSELYPLDSVENAENLKSPRCIKSHLPLELLPEQLWTVKPKIIYVTRDVKDVAVSFYHHHRWGSGFSGTCEEFVEAFVAGIVMYGDYWDHVLRFWEKRKESHVLFNTYEEMKKDLPAVVKRTAEFRNCNLDSEQLEKLCDHLSFESMKNNPSVSQYDEMVERVSKLFKLEGKVEPFMRKGQVGSWKSELTPEIVSLIDKWSEKRLKNTDYKRIS